MNWEAIGAVGEILGAISGESRRLNPINSDTVCTVRSELLQVIIVNTERFCRTLTTKRFCRK